MADFAWTTCDVSEDEREAFGSAERTLALQGETINQSPMSSLRRVSVAGRGYYLKIYEGAGRQLRRHVGRSRVRAEWQNLQFFQAIGLPTARVVAFGEQRGWTARRRGALVTEEIPGTNDLASLVVHRPELLKDRQWLQTVSRRLAGHVRTLHDHHFIHNDLKWRNILVEFCRDPEVYIIDCPLGRTLYGPLFSRGVVKDLACLDKVAKYRVSRGVRLGFYKEYRGVGRLGREDKRRIGKVLKFFEGRE